MTDAAGRRRINEDCVLGKSDKIASPCIDVCTDIRGVCIGCGRTKKDMKAWKKADSNRERLALVEACLEKTANLGTQALWLREYRRKCRKKGARFALGDLDPAMFEPAAD
jgi:predicted Fe-S protein YdhL (DUF1289 family)